jgi:16S rRNA processing protein RimM
LSERRTQVSAGRVGKPHGLDGSFAVEGASADESHFAAGATLYVDGAPARIELTRHARGRPVVRLDVRPPRGATLAVPRAALPAPDDDAYYVFQLVGLAVEEEGGRSLGRIVDVLEYPANDVLELDTGVSLPLVEACVREVDLDGGRIVVSSGFADPA